jgi:hypothetical protein
MAPSQGLFFTHKQLNTFQQSKKAEMSHLVQGMNDDATNKKEMDELAHDLRVNFAERSKEPRR